MFEYIYKLIEKTGLVGDWATYASWAVSAIFVTILAYIINLVARRIIISAISLMIKRSKVTWDDALLERRVFHRAAHIAPALVFYWFSNAFGDLADILARLAIVYMIIVSGLVLNSILNAFIDVYRTLEVAHNRPIKGFVQIIQIIAFVLLGITIIAVLFHQTPYGLLGGLGAMTAVLMLVFKDTILGLVASFQISTSNMVRIGDWIEMPKYSADGDVIDISLHTIKIQNWNKTISTIPTYALISETFKNWRGMNESGGRRIKRSVSIDINSIKFCDEEMIERFTKFQYISEYVTRKKEELAKYNHENKVDTSFFVNGRHMTNIGTFRVYIESYLRNHPLIHKEMTFLVRQLPPGENGLPIEIYVFSSDQRWVEYEAIQADIFDHIFAVLPMFDLRVFQNPSGNDFRKLVTN